MVADESETKLSGYGTEDQPQTQASPAFEQVGAEFPDAEAGMEMGAAKALADAGQRFLDAVAFLAG